MTEQTITQVERHVVKKTSYLVNHGDEIEIPRVDEKTKAQALKDLRRYLGKSSTGRVSVKYSQKNEGIGRYMATDLSQQKMLREIRHTIAGDLYYDIDIVNAAPTMLEQYCVKNEIWCSFLSEYVRDRDAKIAEIVEITGMSRDEVKQSIITCVYGGRCFPHISSEIELPSWVYRFESEMRDIQEIVFKTEETYAKLGTRSAEEKRKKGEWPNPKGSALSLLCQDLENKALMAMRSYLIETGILSEDKGECVLACDGLQVLKAALEGTSVDQLIKDMETAVKDKTGYVVELKNKPMDQGIQLPEGLMDSQPKETIISDGENEASRLFLETVEDDLQKSQGIVYVRRDGIWSSNPKIVDDYLLDRCLSMNFVKFNELTEKTCKYSSNVTAAVNIIKATKARLKPDELFLKALSDSNRGKIVFLDGYYDFDLGQFVEGHDGVHSTIQINRPFPRERDEELIAEIDKRVLTAVLGDKKVLFLQFLARAVAGKTDDKVWSVILGERNSGKGVLGLLITACIESYCTTICPDSLLCQRLSFSGDEAKKLAWTTVMEFTRITITNEIKLDEQNKLKIDGNAIKRLSGGSSDKIMVRHNYQEAREMTVQSTLLMACNDLPAIDPKDAVETLVAFQCPHKFSNDAHLIKHNAHYRQADPNIKAFVGRKDVGDAFFHIIMDHFRDQPVTLTEDMKQFREDFSDGEDANKIICDNFEITTNIKNVVTNAIIKEFISERGLNITENKVKLLLVNKGAKRGCKDKKGDRGLGNVRKLVLTNQEEEDESKSFFR